MQTEKYNEELERFFTLWRNCNAMYENWTKAYGFSCNETLVLNFIHKNKGCTQKQISEGLHISKQTINMILKRFENDGYVVMSVNCNDKRSKTIEMTEKGTAASENILNELIPVELQAVQEMGIERFRSLNDNQELFIELFTKYAQTDF